MGDHVLVRNVCLRGKHKLTDKWEGTVHVIVNQKGDLSVYTIKPENKDSPLKTLHRDFLLPCGFLPALEEKPPAFSGKPQKPSTRQHLQPDPDEQELESDEDDDLISYSFYDPVSRSSSST